MTPITRTARVFNFLAAVRVIGVIRGCDPFSLVPPSERLLNVRHRRKPIRIQRVHGKDLLGVELQPFDILQENLRPDDGRIRHRIICRRQIEHIRVRQDLFFWEIRPPYKLRRKEPSAAPAK